jgi:antitoxin CptB
MNDPLETRKRRLYFRAWHRGTKEADLMIGGFVSARLPAMDEAELGYLETLMHETDVDIMSWVTGTQPAPAQFQGAVMTAMQKLDYIPLAAKPAVD